MYIEKLKTGHVVIELPPTDDEVLAEITHTFAEKLGELTEAFVTMRDADEVLSSFELATTPIAVMRDVNWAFSDVRRAKKEAGCPMSRAKPPPLTKPKRSVAPGEDLVKTAKFLRGQADRMMVAAKKEVDAAEASATA